MERELDDLSDRTNRFHICQGLLRCDLLFMMLKIETDTKIALPQQSQRGKKKSV